MTFSPAAQTMTHWRGDRAMTLFSAKAGTIVCSADQATTFSPAVLAWISALAARAKIGLFGTQEREVTWSREKAEMTRWSSLAQTAPMLLTFPPLANAYDS